MFRAKMLTWSPGLWKKLGLGEEATDEELIAEQEPTAEVVLLIEGREWDKLRDVPGGRARVLEAVESAPICVAPPRCAMGCASNTRASVAEATPTHRA